MTISTNKEKSSEKNFSALDRIKKNKKEIATEVKEDQSISLDNLFSAKKDVVETIPVVQKKEAAAPSVEPTVSIEKEVIELEDNHTSENIESQQINIATKLKHNDFMVNSNTFEPLENVKEIAEADEVVVKKSSAEMAKERLKMDLNLNESQTSRVVVKPSYQPEPIQKITASENLSKLLGNNSVVNEQSIVRTEQNYMPVTEKKPVFVKWEDATAEERSKARKLMSVGVIGTLIALTVSTFH